MSKRLSSSQSNTLLNYFESPKSAKKVKEAPKQNGTKSEENTTNGHSDESPVSQKKRKKIAVIDSDSEEDNVVIRPTPKKKKNVKRSSSDSENDSSHDKGTKLKKFAFEKGAESTSKRVNGDDKKVAPVVGDGKSDWLHTRLDFLKPEKIRDANKRRPDDPDYDPRTLFLPQTFLDNQTPAMRQWWVLKSQHMDSVLFFKVGKFYELYHMDAIVGVTQLGFSYMKGDFAHSGFPESAYHKMANALIEKGFKVARTEQTETPEMMAERCKNLKKTTKFDKVVNREICQITTKATCVYSAQLPEAMRSQSSYMYAICEKDVSSPERHFGVCFIDTSIGTFHLGEFEDDKHCSKLLVCLSEHPPGLILTERKKLSPKFKSVLNTHYKDTRQETLSSESQFYSASATIEKLLNGNYFRDKDNQIKLPPFLKDITEGYNAKPGYEFALKSLGACLWYLIDSKLDIQVVSMGKFEMYLPVNMNLRDPRTQSSMILDSVTMFNLDILGEEGSLRQTIDHCQTAFGKRLLQQWVCRPLCNIEQIRERQEAIEELYKNTTLLEEAQGVLRKLPDLERQLAKIHTYGNKYFARDHPDSRAVFYEAKTYSKRRISDLLKTLNGFELAQNICPIFKGCKSKLLRRITQFSPDGMYADLTDSLLFFKNAFDQEEAQKEGKIMPKDGVDENYDRAQEGIKEVQRRLDEYLVELQKFFDCKVTYFGSDKKRYQIDIPESHTKKVTSEYQLEGTKKGAKPSKRYSTARSKQLLVEMMRAESERAKIIQDLNRRIFEKFSQRHDEWDKAIECITLLDVLCSFAKYARCFSQDMCIPVIEPMAESNKIVIENGRHPCVPNVDSFVPNNTQMGTEDHANVLLITGPNMGGKSTLMRQVAIICIMAHMGGYVPATSCRLNLIDRIFTRLGAHDDIIQGQSTFLLELSEAASILLHATSHSLVLLDELGRGTSTHDGNAIATAYVDKLTTINCRTLFSTHYHSLVDHYEKRIDVQLGHMACMVENDEDPTEESVTFLYKMARGRCPKSYGFNVARLAGLKHNIVARGREIAKELELETKQRKCFRDVFTLNDISTIRGTKCTHYGAPLSAGALGDGRVRCQWHGACFNILNGDIEDFPGLDSLPCYQVTVENDEVKVRARRSELQTNKRVKPMTKHDTREAQHIVVVGGGPSGAVCVETLRQEGFSGQITLVCKENCLPYDRVLVSKTMDFDISNAEFRDEKFYRDNGIEVLKGVAATGVNATQKSVNLSNGAILSYDRLYIATGLSADKADIPGADLANVVSLRDYADSVITNAVINPDIKVVALGSSFIALESAAYCVEKDVKDVTVVMRGVVPFKPFLGEKVGAAFKKMFEDKGVKFITNSGMTRCIDDGSGKVSKVELKDGTVLDADLVIMGVGSSCLTEFVKGSGIEMRPDGTIEVNEYLQSNNPSVYVGGDIAYAPVWSHNNLKAAIGHYPLAHYHGKIAALNMIGKVTKMEAVPYFWTKLFGRSLRYAGHGKFTDIVYIGDVDKLKFVAYYLDGDEVVAASSVNMDPVVSQFAEILSQGKKLYRKDVEGDSKFEWTKMLHTT